jgi:RNA polymerase sigma factor (sigma-70 family)
MKEMPNIDWTIVEQDRFISEAIKRDEPRLRNFIRRRVPDRDDAEDILQEVFYELVEAYRLIKPVEEVSAWLFRVARNRIIDLSRKKKPESFSSSVVAAEDGDELQLEDMLPSADAGPEAAYARSLLLDALEEALDELPPEQSEAFIAHEWMGVSFKDLAKETGVSVNTLLSRKRYAVLHLRRRLRAIYNDFGKQ